MYQFNAGDGAPTTQGFTESGRGSVPPAITQYLGETAWRVEDADYDQPGFEFTRAITTNEVSMLQERGYRVHTRVAFLDTGYNDSNSVFLDFSDGTRRFIFFLDKDGDNRLWLGALNGGAIVLGAIDNTGYYNLSIDVAPNSETAELLVNGEVVITDWNGYSPVTEDPYLKFGSSSIIGRAAAAWNRVQIASRVPESDMTFVYDSSTDGYELDAVANVRGHLHVPEIVNGANGIKNVTVIGYAACSPAFNPNTDLVSLRLPSSLTQIDEYAFENCSGFTGSLTLPTSLASIGHFAFYNCNGFTGSLTLPDSLTSMRHYAFYNCSGFTGSLTLPQSLTTISHHVFEGCRGFSGTLSLHTNLTYIGDYAFSNCSGFEGSLTIPEGVTSIKDSAFRECSGFDGALTIPEGVTSIENYAFYDAAASLARL